MKIVASGAKIGLMYNVLNVCRPCCVQFFHLRRHKYWLFDWLIDCLIDNDVIKKSKYHSTSQFTTTQPRTKKCQRMWFMTGVRKYSWHATTRMCQQTVLLTKRLLEAFRRQNSQEPNLPMLYLTKYCKIFLSKCVNGKNQYWHIHKFLLHPTACLASNFRSKFPVP